MVKVSNGKIVLENRTSLEFENEGVLNPACIEKDGIVHMFYRAVQKGNYSTIGYCQIREDQVIYRSDKPVLVPEYRYESHGLEDPRVTFLENKYYMLYTAYDGKNAMVAYAVSNDLKKWEKKGLISPQMTYDEAENIFKLSNVGEKYTYYEETFRRDRGDTVKLWEKDSMLFPKKINGKYALIHRILPGIQVCYFNDFDDLNVGFWKDYLKNLKNFLILDPQHSHENAYIGGGSVPIETDNGWLMIYHSVESTIDRGNVYHASAVLLDKNDPTKIIGNLNRPLFSPAEEWERIGVINNVVFPTATSLIGDTLYIYYFAADSRIGVRTVSISDLLKELLNENKKAS